MMVARLFMVLQARNRTSFEQMLLHDLGDILGLYHAVEGTVGVYDHDGTERAKTETTGGDQLDFFRQPLDFELFFKRFFQSHASGGGTTCTAADQNMCANHFLSS